MFLVFLCLFIASLASNTLSFLISTRLCVKHSSYPFFLWFLGHSSLWLALIVIWVSQFPHLIIFFPCWNFFCWLPYWPFRGPVLENEQEKVFNSFSHCIRHLKGIRLPSSKYRHSHLPCELRKGQMIRSSSTFLILEAPKIFRLFLTFF
jgi:hypothetical protein